MKRSPRDDANNGSFTPTTTVQLGLDERLTHCNGSLHNTRHMEISFLFIRLRLPACGGCRWKCNFPPQKKPLKMRCAISRRQAGKLFSRITIQRWKFCLPMNHFLISLLPCDSKKGKQREIHFMRVGVSSSIKDDKRWTDKLWAERTICARGPTAAKGWKHCQDEIRSH